MSKQTLISVAVILLVIGGMYGAWEFFVREQIEKYAENEARMQKLDTRLSNLSKTFGNVRPTVVVPEWKGVIEPWSQELRRRSQLFSLGKWGEVEPIPENELPKFYYERKLTAIMAERYRLAQQKGVYQIPMQHVWSAPTMDRLAGTNVKPEMAEKWVSELQLGNGVIEMLLNANAAAITDIQLWEPRPDLDTMNIRTVGIHCNMTLANVTKFLNDLSNRDQYVTVDGFRLTTPGSLRYDDPFLGVQMIISMAEWKEQSPEAEQAAAAAAIAQQQLKLKLMELQAQAGGK